MPDEPRFIDRKSTDPAGADFCLTVSGEDMAPYIEPGDRVFVSCREPLWDMDVGLFLVDGRVVCRQYCEDYAGAVHLLCANPALEAENITLSPARRSELICLGKLLLKRPLPMPIYR